MTYIWNDEILHDDALNTFNLPNRLHIVIHEKSIITLQLIPGIDLEYIYKAFTNTTSLYNYVDKNSDIVSIGTIYYGAKDDPKYDNIKRINDVTNQYKEPITFNI